MGQPTYTEAFYQERRQAARGSAEELVPLLVQLLRPRSVVDVGCGLGTWLAVFREQGVEDVWGIDAAWVDREALDIPAERFRAADLTHPFRLDRTFDLVLSLEVAEHLPAGSADAFVDSLISLGPCVAFSAAIPMQGGVNHVNEQWPEYWTERFVARGYTVIDCLRRRMWQNSRIDTCYVQNTLLFCLPEVIGGSPMLSAARAATCTEQLSIVHPRLYQEIVGRATALIGAAEDVGRVVPPNAMLIVVDDARCESVLAAGRPALPFLERDGVYWGAPPDDDVAIAELERLRSAGAMFLVFAWVSFWWLEHYGKFHRYLRAHFPCVLENERVVIFDLKNRQSAEERSSPRS